VPFDPVRAILKVEAAGAAECQRRGFAKLTWLKQHASPEEWRSKLLETLKEVMLPSSFRD
jgi:hypothetical protein